MSFTRAGRCFRSGYVLVSVFLLLSLRGAAWQPPRSLINGDLDARIRKMMAQEHIPGLSIVVIGDGMDTIRCYGDADLKNRIPVGRTTLFELGSCSKAFTALAVEKLMDEGKIDPEATIDRYIPGMTMYYKGLPARVKVRHLLYHTSGIPEYTLFKIPESTAPDALEDLGKMLNGQRLVHAPGKVYEYASVNYDLLALIVQRVTGRSFETYVKQNVLDALGLFNSSVGIPMNGLQLARGYKTGFFSPREFDAPRYKGNNAAGYVISNASDMEKWLRIQLGMLPAPLGREVSMSHQRDETVPPHGLVSYAGGWEVSLNGSGEIFHSGLNPNFAAYVAFRPEAKAGVVVLANSSSGMVPAIGEAVLSAVMGDGQNDPIMEGDQNDRLFSIGAIAGGVYCLVVLAFAGMILYEARKKKRRFRYPGAKKVRGFLLTFLYGLLFLSGLCLIPRSVANLTWEAALVWLPGSFPVFVAVLLAAFALTYGAYLLGLTVPHEEKLRNIMPGLILISIINGAANMGLVLLITSTFRESVPLKYLLCSFGLLLSLYVLGRRYVQVNLIRFSREATYNMRVKLIDRIFQTSYQKFEKIDKGKIFVTLNDDVSTIGDASGLFVTFSSSVFTLLCAFVYLISIAFWATMLTLALIGVLLGMYLLVSGKSHRYLNLARDARNVFLRLTTTMIEGFKELSLHRIKKDQYAKDINAVAGEYRDRIIVANVRFAYASIMGECLVVMVLAGIAFLFPRIFPWIQQEVIMKYIIVLLYMIGPVNVILNAIPTLLQFRIALNRIKQFLKEIPANLVHKELSVHVPDVVNSIVVQDLSFQYGHNGNGKESGFSVGPIDLEIGKAEILFIAGGNGSGKTTLMKLMTGLYKPDSGCIKINGRVVTGAQLGEFFSVVFTPIQLFEKLYGIDLGARQVIAEEYLKILELGDKVHLEDGRYSTIDLSGGQRKRMGLLQCFLESRPVYLFDEWAADQDPMYRRYFYRTLLPEMKKSGKIVIAITHDDHYFDVADRVFKMDGGRLCHY